MCEDLVSKYGDYTAKESFNKIKDNLDKSTIIDDDYDTENHQEIIRSLVSDVIRKHGDEVFSSYRGKYDGIVDVEDWIGENAEYPVILLNPKNSVTLKEERRIR